MKTIIMKTMMKYVLNSITLPVDITITITLRVVILSLVILLHH